MKHAYFYSHLVSIELLHARLWELQLSVKEKKDLMTISEENLHYVILEVVLEELSNEEKKVFFTHLASHDHEQLWQLLHEKSADIEAKIIHAAEQFLAELHGDIDQAKKITNKS